MESLSHLLSSFEHADVDIFRIACVFPVTSLDAERSVSVLRRIKSFLRNRMGEDVLLQWHYYTQIMK